MSDLVDRLARALAARELILFTGAGFSEDATDLRGRKVPSSDELADELWRMCFPDEPRDDASRLADLYQVALRRHPDELQRLLLDRFTVDPASIPDSYRVWLELPWRRIYTLNVDDLLPAAARRFALDGVADACVYLNGQVHVDRHDVTFAPIQYGERLAQRDARYERLADELTRLPCVFVGTNLDEAPLWQNLADIGRSLEDAPRSWLVTPRVARARRELLNDFGVEWVPMTAAAFAARVLVPVRDRLAALSGAGASAPSA